MRTVNPIDLLMWTFRRQERDVIKLYDSLSDIMRLCTGGDMLNFGCWDGDDPLSAQRRLCRIFAEFSGLKGGQVVLDVGSGYGAPAALWMSEYGVDARAVNVSMRQLADSPAAVPGVNGTATALPFADASVDRVLAFESAQHFRPLECFLSESRRVLKAGGRLALAMPVASAGPLRLGLLSLTWPSEHYSETYVASAARGCGFEVDITRMGCSVYVPLADYYESHRDAMIKSLKNEYSKTVEFILYRSILCMRDLAKRGHIDYVLVSCA